jgi:hypothetical protein
VENVGGFLFVASLPITLKMLSFFGAPLQENVFRNAFPFIVPVRRIITGIIHFKKPSEIGIESNDYATHVIRVIPRSFE